MPSIVKVIEELWIDRKQFDSYYEQVVWTPLKSKVLIISEKNFDSIKKLVEEKKWVSSKKIVKVVKSATPKIIKSGDFASQSGFLSGLWFSTQEESSVVEEIWSLATKTDFDLIKEQVEIQKKEQDLKKPSFGDFNKTKSNFVHNTPRTSSQTQHKQVSQNVNRPNTRPVSKPNNSQSPNRNTTQNTQHQKPNNFSNNKTSNVNFSRPSGNFHNSQNKTNNTQQSSTSNNSNTNNNFVRKKKEQTTSQNLVKKSQIFLDKSVTVKEFSEKMWVDLIELMKALLKNQIMVWINSSIDFDTASLIGADFGIEIKKKEAKLAVESFLDWDLQAILKLDLDSDCKLMERPPIVTVMGHVDHWKTTLLDYLRKTSVASGEAWGITQSIGASVVDYDGKRITFIDTPGHELFTSLRARWAKLTNVAIIVVASDDGLMPQTIESINHAKAAGVPIIIAVTKIDKPWVKIDQIKTDITKYWLTPEDWWGDVPVIWISAITWVGIPDLLEAILLQSEMLELKFNPSRSAVWVVLDAYKDPKQWVVASIILMTWTLQVRDYVVAYNTYWKIKKMWDWKWKDVARAVWWEPVQVLGFTEIPEPGRIVEVVANEKLAISKVELIKSHYVGEDQQSVVQQFLSQLKKNSDEVATLNLVLKSDWSSSLEALKQAVDWINLPQNVDVKVIHSDIWPFSDSDLSLAQASKALLLGFNLPVTNNIKKKALWNWVDVKSFDIIYELTQYLEQIVLWMVKIEQEEVVIWKLDVLGVFYRNWKEMVIGWKVIEWIAQNKVSFRVIRDWEVLASWQITSLQKDKNNVKEVAVWHECGMKVKVWKKIEEKDILEFWEMRDKV